MSRRGPRPPAVLAARERYGQTFASVLWIGRGSRSTIPVLDTDGIGELALLAPLRPSTGTTHDRPIGLSSLTPWGVAMESDFHAWTRDRARLRRWSPAAGWRWDVLRMAGDRYGRESG